MGGEATGRAKKNPAIGGVQTGFCCCRESGLSACVSLWWIVLVLLFAASTSTCWFVLLLVGFFWLRCLVTDVELSFRAAQRPFFVRTIYQQVLCQGQKKRSATGIWLKVIA
jgi:hypothetical protein